MTQKHFWEEIQKHLDIPFKIEEVDNIELDVTGALYFDLKNGKTYSLSYSECEEYDEDDE